MLERARKTLAKILPAAGSIRRRVFVLLGGMGLGAILVTNLIWLPSAVKEIRQDQIELRHVSVQLVRDQVQQYLEDKEKDLTATAQRFRPALVEEDREGLRIIGQRLLQSDPSFEEIGILNEMGKELIRLSRRIAITDRDLADRSTSPLFREGMKQEIYWGPVMITETSEPWVALTIRLPGSATSLKGLVFGIINLKSLWNLTREFKLSHEGRAYIVEEKGRLVAAADPSIVLRQLSFADRPLIQQLIDPKNSNGRSFLEGEYANERGVNVVATGLLLVRPLWGVVIEQPKSLLFAPIRHKIWLFASLSLIGLILSFSLAHILSRRLTEPIIRLQEGAEQVGAGNLEYKVSVETDDEIGKLASQFNRMAQALKASYQGLEEKIAERTQEISTLYSTLAPLAPTDSINHMLEKVIERVMAVTKADACLIRILDKTTGAFVHPAQIGFPSNYLEATQRLQETSAVALAFKTGEPVIAANIAEDPRLKGKRQIEEGLKSCAFLPLKVAGEVRGVIHLASRELGHFNEEKKDHLMAIAHQMGVAMENRELFEEIQRHLERVRALGEIERAITSTLDLQAVLDVLLERIDLVLPYAATTVRLFNTKTGLLEPVACRNLDEEEWKAEQWRAGRGIPNVVFDNKAPVMIGNVQKDPRVRDPEFFRKHGLISYLGVPLVAKDEILGVISFYTKEEHEFTKQEIDFLVALAGQAAIAIHNARLHEETERRRREAEELARVAKSLTETLDVTAVADQVVTSIREILDVKTSTLRLLQPDGSLRSAASRTEGSARGPGGGETVPSGMGITGRAIAEGRPVWSADMLNDPAVRLTDQMRASQLQAGNRSMLAVPLRAREKIIGALALSDQKGRIYTDSEVALVQTFADQAALALENARLFEETERNLRGIRALREIDKAITSTLDLRTILDALLEKIDLLLPYAVTTTVRLFNRESGVLEPLACRNLDEADWKAGRWVSGHGAPGLVFESKEPLTIRNVQTDPRIGDQEFFARHGLISYLGIPLIVKGEILGVLGFYTKEEHQFSDQEVELLTTLAGQAAIAIHNSEVYEELAKLASDLSKANRVKDEFLSVMSHELRTPLNVVMGYTGMIKDRLLGEINPEQERALEKVITRARDQLSMISSILQATQLEAEGVKVEPHEVKLGEFLDDLKLNYALASGKEVNIVWDYPADLPAINTDSEKLKHVLQNLINNAIKFTEKGTVTISARCLDGEGSGQRDLRHASGNGKDDLVRFEVADTGIGIAKENQSMIFERFRQVDSSETREYGGVGIGLYVAKQFTEMLGGKIAVESEVGKGSTFTVTIPCEAGCQKDRQLS